MASKTLPEYIYVEIFPTIINYLLDKIKSEKYGSLFSGFAINEILNYASISKKCFSIVSNQLSNNLNYNNYRILERLTESHTDNINFKLIKSKDSIKVFNEYIKFESFIKNSNSNLYKNIIFEITDPHDFNKVILQLSTLPDNVQLYLLVSDNFEYIINGGLNDVGSKDISKIKRVTFDYPFSPILYNLLNANIKDIDYFDNQSYTFDCKFYFESSSPSSVITIDDLVFPHPLPTLNFNQTQNVAPLINSLSTINQPNFNNISEPPPPVIESLSKLDHFTFHSSIDVLLQRIKQHYQNKQVESTNNESFLESWDRIVEILLNDESLKSIGLLHTCDDTLKCSICGNSFKDITLQVICDGFKKIFQNVNCKVEDLSIYISFNSSIIDSLSLNRSIKNLTIPPIYISPIIHILKTNQTIRNLYININLIQDILDTLLLFDQNSQSLQLYSISFNLYSREINQIKQMLSNKISLLNLPISEINILCILKTGEFKKPDHYSTRYNNTNINIIFWN